MTLLNKYLIKGAEAILDCAKQLDNKNVLESLKILEKSHQDNKKVILCGVGKSGIVARKIAATFSSLSLTSIFLNPLDALHGDLGIVTEGDAVILLSNSGETIEILEILPHLKARKTKVISIVGNLNSSLARESDASLNASVYKEICPLNLAPTASTTVAMAIGDALAAAWMEKVGISQNDFAINHPSGTLGKKLTLKISDLMIPIEEINSVGHDDSIQEIIKQITLGSKNRGVIGATWIKKLGSRNQIDALITDGDLRRILQKYSPDNWPKIKAKDFASFNPITILPTMLAIEAINFMEFNEKKKVYVLPVVKNDIILGMVRMHDLVSAGIV